MGSALSGSVAPTEAAAAPSESAEVVLRNSRRFMGEDLQEESEDFDLAWECYYRMG